MFNLGESAILQALNNLGSVYVDCDKLDLAADCYMNALNIKHTRAHQGLARVYHLKNQRKAAYDEMTKLIEKAQSNASAYEKRSEYCDRDMAKSDLSMATQLDPLRTYPYRYRAAGKFHNDFSLLLVHFVHIGSHCQLSIVNLKTKKKLPSVEKLVQRRELSFPLGIVLLFLSNKDAESVDHPSGCLMLEVIANFWSAPHLSVLTLVNRINYRVFHLHHKNG